MPQRRHSGGLISPNPAIQQMPARLVRGKRAAPLLEEERDLQSHTFVPHTTRHTTAPRPPATSVAGTGSGSAIRRPRAVSGVHDQSAAVTCRVDPTAVRGPSASGCWSTLPVAPDRSPSHVTSKQPRPQSPWHGKRFGCGRRRFSQQPQRSSSLRSWYRVSSPSPRDSPQRRYPSTNPSHLFMHLFLSLGPILRDGPFRPQVHFANRYDSRNDSLEQGGTASVELNYTLLDPPPENVGFAHQLAM